MVLPLGVPHIGSMARCFRAKSVTAAALALLISAAPVQALSLSRPPPPFVPRSPFGHACLNYPPEERRVARQGDVTLDLRTDKTGHVMRAIVVRSSGDAALDAAALTCVAAWTYPPRRHAAKTISIPHRVVVQWRLTKLRADSL
ncbi:MAG TPA: TonB family protein [Rhizomicrobium sp.]|jgi:TonB family protein|nr:TonB family protein [Rhizomicrobium sp.]